MNSQNPSNREDSISLYQLCSGIKKYLEIRLKYKRLWVVAEISNLKKHPNGHIYMDLVEMREGKTIAKLQGNIWSSRLAVIKEKIGNDLENILDNGNNVLFQLSVSFHEVYGLKVEIHDVDINYSLGELEKKRQATIERLRNEHLMDRNKSKKLPMVVQKFLLIASEGSSGYKDFINQITNNSSGYKFDFEVLNTLVQGDRAEDEIIRRLSQANRVAEIDAVLILRGGGSKLDLEVFNSYDLCFAIANHSKPVLTGIGHETDLCVADLVAHEYLKTPTALAEFLHERANAFETAISDHANEICRTITSRIHFQQRALLEFQKDVKNNVVKKFERQQELYRRSEKVLKDSRKDVSRKLDSLNSITRTVSERVSRLQSSHRIVLHELKSKVHMNAKLKIEGNDKHLTALSQLIFNINPRRLIERGYATVSIDGVLLRKDSELKIGDKVTVHVFDKEIVCEIINIKDQWTLNLMKKLLKS